MAPLHMASLHSIIVDSADGEKCFQYSPISMPCDKNKQIVDIE